MPQAREEARLCVVEGCDTPMRHPVSGLCVAHFLRMKRHGDPLAGRTGWGVKEAWLRGAVANATDECALWPFVTGDQYGSLRVEGKRWLAHRLALVWATGENPTHLDAAHACHNRRCVNPKHLSWKTRRENALDRRRDGTASKKLTLADVNSIRSSTLSARDLADMYGTVTQTIYDIRNGRSWK